MNETEKTNKLRGSKFLEQYMSGKLIDIGAGKDLVCEWAERFDIEDGDANFITSYRKKASYDTVHSSHCLEHMFDPKSALKEWWELVKPNGYMIIVVPDENLYEQGIWPAISIPIIKTLLGLMKVQAGLQFLTTLTSYSNRYPT